MTLKKGESATYTSKRGTRYTIYNDCGHILVGKQIHEKKRGEYCNKEVYVNPTKEITSQFVIEAQHRGVRIDRRNGV